MTVLNVHLFDINPNFIHGLTEQFGQTAEVQLRVKDKKKSEFLLSEQQFWAIIDALDWKKNKSSEIIKPAIEALSKMPIAAIYLFADKLAEKLYLLDSKENGSDFNSSDSFLYVRCAVVAEGKTFYENVLSQKEKMPSHLFFEPILNIADAAFELKTGENFNYFPPFNIETGSNKKAWI